MKRTAGTLNLGRVVNAREHLLLADEARRMHLYVVGATGTGKSKFLESLVRQDIVDQRSTGAGLLLLDPHGSLYHDLLAWMSWHRIKRPLVCIDLSRDDWVVAYNLLRRREEMETAVIVGNLVEAMAHVWGQAGTDQTPLFARWASDILHTLYANGHTLNEATFLTHAVSKQLRQAMTEKVNNPAVKRDWDFANALTPAAFDQQMSSSINRLQRFVAKERLQRVFGHPEISLDLRAALDEGHIILVNLSTQGGKIDHEDARLFGTLLLTDLWTAAKQRGKSKKQRPFSIYLDEFQHFITPTIAENLDEARGYGLRLTLAHQFPHQLLRDTAHGQALLNSVMTNARSKVVFGGIGQRQGLEELAEWLTMGVLNPDEIKHELYSTKVMDYQIEYQKAYSRSHASTRGESSSYGSSSGNGSGSASGHVTSSSYDADGNVVGSSLTDSASASWNSYFADTYGESTSWSETDAESESDIPMLIPVLGQELSHVQFRSLEEQLYRAMAVLFDQEQRQAVVRLAGMKAPVSIFTPFVKDIFASSERIERFIQATFLNWPFALPVPEAARLIAERRRYFEHQYLEDHAAADEPKTYRRRKKTPDAV